MSKLDIIIPVFNEGENFIKILKLFKDKLKMNYNVLICFDSYNDTTLDLIKKNKFGTNIALIKNKFHGPNTAIIEGILKSKSDILLVYMADDFHNIELINSMYKHIESGYDIIIPSRFIDGGKFNGATFYKKIITLIGSFLINKIVGIPYRDCTNAFKMFKKNIFQNINLESKKGFTYALELTIKSYYFGYKIKEVPSIWKELEGRKSNFKIFKWLPYYTYWLIYALLKKIRFF